MTSFLVEINLKFTLTDLEHENAGFTYLNCYKPMNLFNYEPFSKNLFLYICFYLLRDGAYHMWL